jgi:hypothetical protein
MPKQNRKTTNASGALLRVGPPMVNMNTLSADLGKNISKDKKNP